MTFFKITLACLLVIGIVNIASVLVEMSLRSEVYACNDKEKNPPDVQKLCQQLTKYQWWGAYYKGKQP
jgi:hypothetical protein